MVFLEAHNKTKGERMKAALERTYA